MQVWIFRGKQVFWWVFLCLACGIFWGSATRHFEPASTTLAYYGISGKTVVLDAGHGGIDPGAVSGAGALEKIITLEIAQELESLLKKAAVYVIMVRQGDYDLADTSETNLLFRKRQDLERRIWIAEEAQADVYISIHANYFPSPIWSGAQTFYYPGLADDQHLAETIQTELVRHLGPNHRLAQSGNYRVLRDTSMPAALVEVGFLSNPHEAKLLGQAEYQKQVAGAIFSGLMRYFNP